MDRYHYRFVKALKSGLCELGEGDYNYPLVRGQVVTLVDSHVPLPVGDGFMTSKVRGVVEQIEHPAIRVRPPLSEVPVGSAYRTIPPLPHSVAEMIVYVSLLDEGGRIIPQDYGDVPGLTVTVTPSRDEIRRTRKN